MNKAFSLIELSIVLVILGLITGGIMAGKSLMRAAELKSITRELQQYRTAFSVFNDEYGALPGDLDNATAYWGRADNGTFSGQCADPVMNTGTGTKTCNGDGNGYLAQNGTTDHESFRAWQHLSNAGLVPGIYTGITAGAAGTYSRSAGVNVPKSKVTDGRWLPRNLSNYNNGSSTYFKHDYGNMLNFEVNALTPKEAGNIDSKMDDGKPGTGKAIIMDWTNCTDATANDPADALAANYVLSDNENKECGLAFPKSI